MITDRKICDNCVHRSGDGNECLICENLNRWRRNPHLWLDIPPEQEEWYFHRYGPDDKSWTMHELKPIYESDELGYDRVAELYLTPISELEGQWQGPIEPEGE